MRKNLTMAEWLIGPTHEQPDFDKFAEWLIGDSIHGNEISKEYLAEVLQSVFNEGRRYEQRHWWEEQDKSYQD